MKRIIKKRRKTPKCYNCGGNHYKNTCPELQNGQNSGNNKNNNNNNSTTTSSNGQSNNNKEKHCIFVKPKEGEQKNKIINGITKNGVQSVEGGHQGPNCMAL